VVVVVFVSKVVVVFLEVAVANVVAVS